MSTSAPKAENTAEAEAEPETRRPPPVASVKKLIVDLMKRNDPSLPRTKTKLANLYILLGASQLRAKENNAATRSVGMAFRLMKETGLIRVYESFKDHLDALLRSMSKCDYQLVQRAKGMVKLSKKLGAVLDVRACTRKLARQVEEMCRGEGYATPEEVRKHAERTDRIKFHKNVVFMTRIKAVGETLREVQRAIQEKPKRLFFPAIEMDDIRVEADTFLRNSLDKPCTFDKETQPLARMLQALACPRASGVSRFFDAWDDASRAGFGAQKRRFMLEITCKRGYRFWFLQTCLRSCARVDSVPSRHAVHSIASLLRIVGCTEAVQVSAEKTRALLAGLLRHHTRDLGLFFRFRVRAEASEAAQEQSMPCFADVEPSRDQARDRRGRVALVHGCEDGTRSSVERLLEKHQCVVVLGDALRNRCTAAALSSEYFVRVAYAETISESDHPLRLDPETQKYVPGDCLLVVMREAEKDLEVAERVTWLMSRGAAQEAAADDRYFTKLGICLRTNWEFYRKSLCHKKDTHFMVKLSKGCVSLFRCLGDSLEDTREALVRAGVVKRSVWVNESISDTIQKLLMTEDELSVRKRDEADLDIMWVFHFAIARSHGCTEVQESE